MFAQSWLWVIYTVFMIHYLKDNINLYMLPLFTIKIDWHNLYHFKILILLIRCKKIINFNSFYCLIRRIDHKIFRIWHLSSFLLKAVNVYIYQTRNLSTHIESKVSDTHLCFRGQMWQMLHWVKNLEVKYSLNLPCQFVTSMSGKQPW